MQPFDLSVLPAGWEVPAFLVSELRPRQSKYAIGIPVINEGTRLVKQLERMAALPLQTDIVIADGGSTDGTTDSATLNRVGVRAALVKTGPGKLSAQMRMFFAFAMSQGYEGCVLLDGNGKDGVEAIPSFLAALDEGYDFVQGSRYVPGGVEENTPWERHLGVKLLHAPLISAAARFRYTDTTNGFRAYSRRFLLDDRVLPFRDAFQTYNLHYYLSIRAARLRFRVKELPVSRRYPAAGPIPSKIGGWKGKAEILKLLWLSVTGHYNPKESPSRPSYTGPLPSRGEQP